ncbi:MAG: YceI family protein [Rubrivivax sp.]
MTARAAAGVLLLAGAAATAAAPVDYQLTPTHSFVHIEWLHAGLSTLQGRFDQVRGRVQLDREARRGNGRIELRLDSVNTGRAALDAELRRRFGAEAQAPLVLELVALRFDGDQPAAAELRWPWRGTQETLVLQAQRFSCYTSPLLLREVCGGDFSAELDLQALGLLPDPALRLAPRLRLNVQVEAVRVEGDS